MPKPQLDDTKRAVADEILSAIETLKTPFSFGSIKHVAANRLIAQFTPIECGQCDEKGEHAHPGDPKRRIECTKCHGQKKGYRGRSGVFWLGVWAPQHTWGLKVY